jgi:hypothetical protein
MAPEEMAIQGDLRNGGGAGKGQPNALIGINPAWVTEAAAEPNSAREVW